MRMKPSPWFSRNSTFFVLTVPLLLISAVTFLIGDTLIERIITVLFVDVILVLALQVFMGNSGILSFAVAGFMGIGAYGSVLFSMTPAAKAAALPDLYPFLTQIQLPFVVSVLIGGLIAALVAAVVAYPLMRLSDAAGVITIFSLLVIINVVLVHWSSLTNGPRTLFGVDRFTYLGTATVFAIVFLAVAWWFKESSVGLKLRASRDDAFAAASIGINIVMMRYFAFVLSAFMAGFRRRPVGPLHHLVLPVCILSLRHVRIPLHARDRRPERHLGRGDRHSAGYAAAGRIEVD